MFNWLRHALKSEGQHIADIRAAHNAGYVLGYKRGKEVVQRRGEYTFYDEWSVRQGGQDYTMTGSESGRILPRAVREAEAILEEKNANG